MFLFSIRLRAKKNPFETYFPGLDAYFKEHNLEFTYYLTEHRGHATEIARLEAEKGDDVRIFGFGGDGTLRGDRPRRGGPQKAEVGIFPCGSGNDYVRTFGDGLDFNDDGAAAFGESKTVDMIRADDDRPWAVLHRSGRERCPQYGEI